MNLLKFTLQNTLEYWVIYPKEGKLEHLASGDGVHGLKNLDYWMSSVLSPGFELVSTELTSLGVNPAKIPSFPEETTGIRGLPHLHQPTVVTVCEHVWHRE